MDLRKEVRDFLVGRRARISPGQAGLPDDVKHRRVPGLRREEVANLAGVSVGYLLFRRLDHEDKRLRRPTSIVYLLLIAMAASFAAGLVGAAINPMLFQGSHLYGLGFWFASELVNYMAILPVILTLPPPGTLPGWRRLLYQTNISWSRLLPLLSLVGTLLLTLLIEGPGSIAFPVPALLDRKSVV